MFVDKLNGTAIFVFLNSLESTFGALTCLPNSLEPLGDTSPGSVQVCCDSNIVDSSVRQKRRVAGVFSLVSSCIHLTYKTVFHAESLRGRFSFREFVCQTFTVCFCFPSCGSLCPSCLPAVPLFSLLVSLLSPFLLVIVSALCSFSSPFVSGLVLWVTVTCWSLRPPCLPSCLPLSPVLSPDTMANKKGANKGHKRKQKGDKTDTRTNKKGDKRKQKGDMTNKGTKVDRRETRRTQ